MEAMAKSHRPQDIMDVKWADPVDASYTKIFANGTPSGSSVVPGKERSRASWKPTATPTLAGGSMGFTKMEGTTVNIKDKIAVFRPSERSRTRWCGTTPRRLNAASNISVPAALKAGVVMQHNLTGGRTDTSGAAINSEWVPVARPTALDRRRGPIAADALGNTADPETIGNPDNLKFSEKLRTLFIGEDSGHARQQLPVGVQHRYEEAGRA